MGEFVLFIFMFVAIMTLVFFLFGGWVVVVFFRGMLRMLSGGTMGQMPQASRACEYMDCRAENPMGARFCRRCGRELQAEQVMTRRVVRIHG